MFRVIACGTSIFLTALMCGTWDIPPLRRCFRVDIKTSEIQPVGRKSDVNQDSELTLGFTGFLLELLKTHRDLHMAHMRAHTHNWVTHRSISKHSLFELRSHMEQICVQIWIYGVFSGCQRKSTGVFFFLMEVKRHFTLRGGKKWKIVLLVFILSFYVQLENVAAKMYH